MYALARRSAAVKAERDQDEATASIEVRISTERAIVPKYESNNKKETMSTRKGINREKNYSNAAAEWTAERGDFATAWKKAKEIVGEVAPLDETTMESLRVEFEALKDDKEQMEREPEHEDGKALIDDCPKFMAVDTMDVDDSASVNTSPEAMDVEEDNAPPFDVDGPIFQPFQVVEPSFDESNLKDYRDDDSFDISSDEDMAESDNRETKKSIDVRLLAEILDAGNKATAHIGFNADVVLVIGGTGVGKSTFIQAIAGNAIKRGWDASLNKPCYVLDGTGEPGFEIGQGLTSQTMHVRSFLRESTSTYFFDSAGFGDNRGIEVDIATSVCVKAIAARAERLRFVVLINAYTFFVHRASELRKNLDLVAHFVGHNFQTYKKSFTFLFTHCNEAFASVRNLIDQGTDKGTVMKTAREELYHLLSETKKGTMDEHIRHLIHFLQKNLEKGYPFCDVFDPLLSNVPKIRSNVEPRNRCAIEKPKKHVKCSLTSTSRLVLNLELSKHREDIEKQLEQGIFDLTLRKEVLAIFTLANHIGEVICTEQAVAIRALLEQASAKLKDQVFQAVQNGILLEKENEFDSDQAEVAKDGIGNMIFVENLLRECLALTTNVNDEHPFIQINLNEHEVFQQLLDLLKKQADWMLKEASKIRLYFAGESDRPDLNRVANKLGQLRSWARAFEGKVESMFKTVLKHLGDSVIEVMNDIERPQSKPLVAEGTQALQAVALLKNIQLAGLSDLLLAESSIEITFWDDCYAKSIDKAEEILRILPCKVQLLVTRAFDYPMDIVPVASSTGSSDQNAFVELQNVMNIAEEMSLIIGGEGIRSVLRGAWPRHEALIIAKVEYIQRCDICTRLISQFGKDNQGAELLLICFESLQVFSNSLPLSMQAEGRFLSHIEQLCHQLSKRLTQIASCINLFTGQLELSGLNGDLSEQKRCLSILESCIWFDSFALGASASSEEPFVRTTLDSAMQAYGNYSNGLFEAMKNSLIAVLSEKDSEGTIREYASFVVESSRTLRKVAAVTGDNRADSFFYFSREHIQRWCKEKSEMNLPDSIEEVDYAQVDMVLVIAESIKSLDNDADGDIDDLIFSIENKCVSYCLSVEAAMEDNDNFRLKCSMLNAAQKWARCSTLKKLLPSYDRMRRQARQQIVDHAEVLHKKINAAQIVELKDVEGQIQYLLDATKYIDAHIDGEASSWANTIIRILETRKAEMDGRFQEMVDANDFPGMKTYLSKLKSSRDAQEQDQYRKCLKLLSVTLWQIIAGIRSIFESPYLSVNHNPDDIKGRLELLQEADDALGRVVKKFPPASPGGTSWALRDEITTIKIEANAKIEAILSEASFAVDRLDFITALVSVKHGSFLHKVTKPKRQIGKLKNNRLVSNAQENIRSLFFKIDESVAVFLNSFANSQTHSSRKSMDSGSNAAGSHGFPPDTSFLRHALGQLKNATTQIDCPTELKNIYDDAKVKLAVGLNELYDALQGEIKHGKFTRPLKILGFLQEELGSRQLKAHVELKFDVVAAISDITDQKHQLQKAMKLDLQDNNWIDCYAERLNSLSSSFGWYRDDYDYYRQGVSAFVNDVLNETKDMVRNLNFIGLRGRFLVIERIQLKLGKHLTLASTQAPGDIVTNAFFSRVTDFLQDMETSFQNKNMDNFHLLFAEFHTLMVDVPTGESNRTPRYSTKESIIKKFDQACFQLQRSVHRLLLQWTQEFLQSFSHKMEKHHYEEASIEAEKLRDIGYFFGSTFEYYRSEQCVGLVDADLTSLVSLINKSFATGEFLVTGRNVAILHLLPSANIEDVRKAFLKQSRRWHPDKNKHDKRAHDRFIQIKNAANFLKEGRKLENFREYDFLYLVEGLRKVPKRVQDTVHEALERNEYDMIARICGMLDEVESLHVLLRSGMSTPIDVNKIRQDVFDKVKKKSNALLVDIQSASKRHDFVSLHHSFIALEDLETAFKMQKEVVSGSMTAKVLDEMVYNLKELKEGSTFLRGKDEVHALELMDDFGLQLIKIGSFLDGFPRLKKETTTIIHSLLNGIKEEPWGITFTFKLGLRLENGEVSGSDEDKRVGRVIAGSFPHFKDVQTVVFNRRVVTADEANSIEKTKTFRYTSDIEMKEVKLDRANIKSAYDTYEEKYNSFFTEFVERGHNDLVQRVFHMAQELGPCEVSNWDDRVKEKIIEIIAGIFATFTIIKSGDSFNHFDLHDDDVNHGKGMANTMDIVFRPHSIQVIAILRLLGIGTMERLLPNHIMEIRTGEGKSMILGALSVLLSLLGFTVRCVCYSEHLSERDNELFKDVFIAFDVESRIIYSKITAMSEDSIAEKGDIRQLTLGLINGDLVRESVSKKHLIKESSEPVFTSTSVVTSGDIRAQISGSLVADDAPLPLNGNVILLVDEVDVFFGPDFYGKTYNQLAEVENRQAEQLLRRIWQHRREKLSFSIVNNWPEYKSLMEKLGDWRSVIDTEVRRMCVDVENFDEPAYEVDTVNSRIGYSIMDSVDWDVVYGYRTAFAQLNEHEKGTLKGPSADESLRRALCLRVSCGQFSFAKIFPHRILGVSGTLRALSETEKKIVMDFGVDTYTFVPSVYGANNLDFKPKSRGYIAIESEKVRYLQEIANRINEAIRKERAAIVFFENDERLQEFKKSAYWRNFRHVNILSSTTSKDDRNHIIKKAATTNQITISTATFGRGTDFFCKDAKLEENNGLLVIQTFLSLEKSEEIQIQGRTARQGQKGSYCMVLLESDLTQKYDITPDECASVGHVDLYDLLDKRRQKKHSEAILKTSEELKGAEERDRESRAYLDALVAGDKRKAAAGLNAIYKGIRSASRKLKFCRMVCLSDATGSMCGLWSSTKEYISEMLRRIDNIGEGQFELLWVAYRDYSDGAKLLQKSKWSKDPNYLKDFISSISCGGGDDFPEAVEWALKEANEEHEKEPVTRVLLIGDAPPHPERKGQVLAKHGNRVMSTDYLTEASKLKLNQVPVYAFRVDDNEETKDSFDRIARLTSGESHLLSLGSSDGAKKLIDSVCMTALEDIGGSELIEEYRKRY